MEQGNIARGRVIKRYFLFITCISLVLVGLVIQKVQINRPVRQFEQAIASLGSKKLKSMVVHVWSPRCLSCVKELPEWVEWVSAQKGVLAIALSPKLPELHLLPGPIVWIEDPGSLLAQQLGTFELPETYWMDSQQKILKKWVGVQDWKHLKIDWERFEKGSF